MTDKSQSFQDLLDKDTSVTIHQRNIRNLATEIWKFLQGYFPPILSEVFTELDCNYNLKCNKFLNRRRVLSKVW